MWSQIQTVVAAFFGVQSDAKRQQDFSNHNPKIIIALAIALFVIFVLAVFGLVQLVLATG
ncbi:MULTISPECIES: DUF2970 domain-containing protein [Pseudoalteromonas]|uniref:DUF2970 domain-containing protein n=1 Tax=Pseudoalteromonas qingdaonensis TaxID=3131913 RepID=A0ABU9MVJ8_9GAMM|nr:MULTISPECIES: DUF2970 domain-containing protein [unclassified Pseudoalteromonas]